MADLGYEQTSGFHQAEMAKTKREIKRAERDKLLQEVYDLSVNNEAQAMAAKEFTSAQFQETRRVRDKAAQAEAQAGIAKAALLMDDIRTERMQKAIGLLESNPNQQVYKNVRAQIALSEPYLGEQLPDEWGPEAQQMIKSINDAAIMSKAHRQQLNALGIKGDQMARLQEDKYRREARLQASRFRQEREMLSRKIDARIAEADVNQTGALRRARLQAGGQFENMAMSFENLGMYDKAEEARLLGMQMEMMAIEAAALKAQTGGTDPSLVRGRSQEYNQKLVDSVKDFYDKDPYVIRQTEGFDPDAKAAIARNKEMVIDQLQQSMPKNIYDNPRQAKSWITDRMMYDNDSKAFKPLPMDAQGNPAYGIKGSDIRGWVGQTHRSVDGTPIPSYLQEVDDMDDAMELYKWILQSAGPKMIIW